jgi:hypothetical protein
LKILFCYLPYIFSWYLNENVVLQNTCMVRSPLNLIRKIAKRATTQSGESKKPCLLISGNRIIKQERASVREEEALVESWRCHAQGPKRIPFYHFSPQITFFAVAAADCLLDREESSKKRMKKDLPQSPKSKSRKSQG